MSLAGAVYMEELVLAELIFLFSAEKRRYFCFRVIAVLLASPVLVFLLQIPDEIYARITVQFFLFMGMFFVSVGEMGLLFHLQFPALFSLCVAGYAVQHIAFHTAKIIRILTGLFQNTAKGLLQQRELVEFVVFPPVYLIAFLTLGLFVARNQCWKKADARFNGVSIVTVFICVGLTRFVNRFGDENSITVSLYAITACIMALVVQFVLYRIVDLNHENETMSLLWQEERKQYELSRKTIDTINIKYHDLKHRLHALALPQEDIESIKDAVRVYGSRFRTGNEALDVLLTENSLRCGEEGIQLTFAGNGQNLGFMSASDVYSLFGNAVENAVEAVRKLDDPEKKIVDIVVERRGQLIGVIITNFFSGDMKMENGLPVTTKQEEPGFHGYGVKSMRLIAEKYGGNITATAEEDLFTLSIYLMAQTV